jgi:hypothetical protein
MVKISEQSRDFRVTARWVSLIIVRRRRVRRSKPTCFSQILTLGETASRHLRAYREKLTVNETEKHHASSIAG